MVTSYHDRWIKRAKLLTQVLIISGALNVGFLSTFIYFAMKETGAQIGLVQNYSQAANRCENLGLQQLLEKYSALTFQELLLRLSTSDHVEEGYTSRDLALACLVHFHYFNLERALGGLTPQTRQINFRRGSEEISIIVFPGLADYQYQAIAQFTKTERWPFTAKGLFNEICLTKPPYNPTLLEAFYLTSEFHFLSTLFSKTGIPLKKEHMVALLSGGSWEAIENQAKVIHKSSEFTLDRRRQFLMELIKDKSKLAGKILLQTDLAFCLKRFTDEQILTLCELLGDWVPSSFAKSLLKSPRSDKVWKKAASLLYLQAAEEVPEEINLEDAKLRFIQLKMPKKTRPATSKKTDMAYTVQSGDSLWKIANKHKVSVRAIQEANNLKTDCLHPGQVLQIP